MKTFMSLSLSLFLFSNLYSKIDSTRQNYFPHHLGDRWVYYVRNGVGDDTLQVTIISDSTDKEGNAYVRYSLLTRKPNDPPQYYWHEYYKIDTAGNIYIGNGMIYSRLQFKATAQFGERWATGYDVDTAHIYEILDGSVFGRYTTIKRIGHDIGTEGYGESYAVGFGIISRKGSYAIAGELYLLAAKINGIKYGDTTLTDVSRFNFQSTPVVFQLLPNYPNPFNNSTIIRYFLAERGEVRLTVFDILGRDVNTLVDNYQEQGQYAVNFDAAYLSSGIYFYRLETKNMSVVGKMILQK